MDRTQRNKNVMQKIEEVSDLPLDPEFVPTLKDMNRPSVLSVVVSALRGASRPLSLQPPGLTVICTYKKFVPHASLIPTRKHILSSELISESGLGEISTGIRDGLGTPRGDVFFHVWTFFVLPQSGSCPNANFDRDMSGIKIKARISGYVLQQARVGLCVCPQRLCDERLCAYRTSPGGDESFRNKLQLVLDSY
jgi:hypothetical protein